MRSWLFFSLAAVAVCDGTAAAQPTQPIYLQYDGFVRNKNGTFTLAFGYFNMNNVEVTVAAGDADLSRRRRPIAINR